MVEGLRGAPGCIHTHIYVYIYIHTILHVGSKGIHRYSGICRGTQAAYRDIVNVYGIFLDTVAFAGPLLVGLGG